VQLIPAIDIRGGRCVRLLKGDFGAETRYDVDPVELAARYRDLGAEWLHVVDLDGARSGRPVSLPLIGKLRALGGLKLQIGGGIRDHDSLDAALTTADRVVVGSLAVTAPDDVAAWLDMHGAGRFVLGFDVRIGPDGQAQVTTHGWTRSSALTLQAAVARYLELGLEHVLCTDVERDGALGGPNLALYGDCVRRWPGVKFQASGGVRGAADLDALADTGVAAAISGKALLEGRMTDEEIRRFLPNG
jgi:phosphoribosylformimino-5-aminoimidazole carboxamide ribotide isomerase